MAKESFQLDPEAGGVSQAEFDAHIEEYNIHNHNYDKMTSCSKSSLCDPYSYTPNQTGEPNII